VNAPDGLGIDELFATLAQGARARDGETVTLLAHALQCAQLLEASDPDDTELQVAGLVHDIGTTIEPNQPATHATTGARAVRALLGDRVADLVGRHDEAKRYLVTVDTAYRGRLSARSIETLADQGGLLDDAGRATFEASPGLEACVALRRADDDAKVPGLPTRRLETWRPAVDSLASRRV
jgi:predicted HD phosphohydrolase